MIRFFTLLLAASCLTAVGQDNILDVRQNYQIGQTVTVRGVVTTDDNLGSIRYMQDETAAIAIYPCLLYTSPSPRDMRRSRMPSSA